MSFKIVLVVFTFGFLSSSFVVNYFSLTFSDLFCLVFFYYFFPLM